MTVNCLHCQEPTNLVTGEQIYPHRKDLHSLNFWLCSKCGAYCGCHKGGDGQRALGYPCNAETRKARSFVHRVFDPLWKRGTMKRGQAYKWLASKMDLPFEDTHISMFTVEQCRQAYRICKSRNT